MHKSRWNRISVILTMLMAGIHSSAACALPRPVFYCSFDDSADADISLGNGSSTAALPDAILYKAARDPGSSSGLLVKGRVGRGMIANSLRQYQVQDNFNPLRGSIMMWVQPTWRGNRRDLYAIFFSCRDWGMIYKYKNQDSVTFAWTGKDGAFEYKVVGSVADWSPGEWHHLAVTFDAKSTGKRTLYIDGARVGAWPISSYRQCGSEFGIGAGIGGVNPARSVLDEVAIYDRVLTDAEISEAYAAGLAGKPLAAISTGKKRAEPDSAPPPPSGLRPKPPVFVDWRLPPGPAIREWRLTGKRGGRTATSSRERISLNGMWRFRPCPGRAWHYMRIPGTWAIPKACPVLSGNGTPINTVEARNISDIEEAWLEREFTVPPEWQGKRIILGLDSVRAIGDVYLNGRRLGQCLEHERTEFNVSQYLRKSTPNLLQVHVQTLVKGRKFRGLDQDVWLEQRPRGPVLKWVAFHPLVRSSCLEVTAEASDLSASAELTVSFRSTSGATTGRVRIKITNGLNRAVVRTPFLRPWHPDSPRLYIAHPMLTTPDGRADELYPIRFGYRQMEIHGGDFLLNGRKFHVRGQSSPSFGSFLWNTAEPQIRAWISRMKSMHVNAAREHGRWESGISSQWRELYFDIADEMGFMIFPQLPSNRLLLNDFQQPTVAGLYQRRLADFVHRYGNHACVAMWFLNFNTGAHAADINPDLLDGSFDPRVLPEKQASHAWMDFSERTLLGIDASRPLFHHAAGNYGQVLTVMAYLGFGIPLQEREEWPYAWSRTRFKPLMPVETGFPCLLSNYRERVGALTRVYASEQLTPEYFTAYIGDRVYANLTREEALHLNPGTAGSYARMAAMKRSINYQEQKALFARRTLRSWRALDISGYMQHVEWRDCFKYETKTIKLPPSDPRDFGLRTAENKITIQHATGQTLLGRECAVSNAPALAWIAGPANGLTNKDHAFFAGENIEKSIILINDHADARTFTVQLTVELGENLIHEQHVSIHLDSGNLRKEPVRFRAPDVRNRTEGMIHLSVEVDNNKLRPDSFAWQCFPRSGKMRFTNGAPVVTLLDRAGKTGKVCEQAGLNTTGKLEPGTSLLIIGRESLDNSTRQLLTSWRIMDRVRRGLNVLVFEQTGQQLAGMPMDAPNCRAVFIRAPRHPVMTGITNADLRNWRGQSHITRPYPRTDRAKPLTWEEEFMRWSNQGVVCSFAPEKPQRGTFTVLVDADYDLYLAPLLEWRLGQGRIIFCQLDVTGRYGIDPVATNLVHQLIRYLARQQSGTAIPTANTETSETTAALARSLSVISGESPPAPILIGPDWNGNAEKLKQRISTSGVRALLIGLQNEKVMRTLFSSSIRQVQVFKVAVPTELAQRGLGPGDFFWRECRQVPVLAEAAENVVHTSPPVVALRRLGRGEVIWCGILPSGFRDSRQITKTIRVLSLLLGAGASGPDLTATEADTGSAKSPYAMRHLGFNPYHYRRW